MTQWATVRIRRILRNEIANIIEKDKEFKSINHFIEIAVIKSIREYYKKKLLKKWGEL
ncbi:MAG: hypothetical protein QXU20_03790 [Candidatus Woesearchaeota archaeon]